MDLHFGNFFVDTANQQITLFDFDDCAYGWYIMDIAMLLFDVLVVYASSDRLQFGERFLVNVLRGYYEQMPANRFWIRELPRFIKLVEIGVYLMLCKDYDPETTDEWAGKFMPGRRDRILNDVSYIDLDFDTIFDKAVA